MTARPAADAALVRARSYVAFTFAVTTRRNAIRRRLNQADNALHAELADALANREVVALHGAHALAAARFEARLGGHEAAQLDVAHSLALLNFGQAAILSTGIAAVTLLAARGCLDGTLSLGDVVLANQLLLGLSAPLNVLGMVRASRVARLASARCMPSPSRPREASPPSRRPRAALAPPSCRPRFAARTRGGATGVSRVHICCD